ncbi:MAG: metalloregulator ArsR/SmtB family transcription factor [Anaerolineaceae bacterium]|jgi:ArsR family transcriptional regulator
MVNAPEQSVTRIFHELSQPARLQILLMLGEGEACVCHLESYLGLRQATISQHLMALRDAGLVTTHRDGRNIYYVLSNPHLLDIVHQAAALLDIPGKQLVPPMKPLTPCPCPHCNPGKLTCD